MKRLYHVGLTVSDLERSIAFYHNVLALEFACVPTDYVSEPELDVALRVPGAVLRRVNFEIGDCGVLELLEYREPPSLHERALPCNTVGSGHVAFLVDDITARKAELEAQGVEFFSDINYAKTPRASWYWVYFADPDGIPLELVQTEYENTDEIAEDICVYKEARGHL